MARSADELQSQSLLPSSQLQNKQLWSKGASFTRNDLHEAARRSFAKSRRATRHEERELELEMEKRQPQLPSCNTNESKSFCCRSTASAVEGAQGGGAGQETACVLRRLPRSLSHTHTHTSCACGGPICFGVPVPVPVPAWSWLCLWLWLWLGRGLAPVATATASEAAAAARGYGATWSLGHGHNKLPTTGAKCSIMLTSYSVKTTKKHNNNNNNTRK